MNGSAGGFSQLSPCVLRTQFMHVFECETTASGTPYIFTYIFTYIFKRYNKKSRRNDSGCETVAAGILSYSVCLIEESIEGIEKVMTECLRIMTGFVKNMLNY